MIRRLLWRNFLLATALFFGWLVIDSASSILFSSPLEGVYYPLTSGRLKHVPSDWTNKSTYAAGAYLAIFGVTWILFIRLAGLYAGCRLAALVTSFLMLPFWFVSWVTMDMYDLSLNGWWLASMIYANVSFFLFGFLGRGTLKDLRL